MYDSIAIGNRIYHARNVNGLKQHDVGRFLGLGQSAYSDIETGKRDVTISELYILADKLNAPVSWLLGLDIESGFSDSELLKIEEYKLFLISLRKK